MTPGSTGTAGVGRRRGRRSARRSPVRIMTQDSQRHRRRSAQPDAQNSPDLRRSGNVRRSGNIGGGVPGTEPPRRVRRHGVELLPVAQLGDRGEAGDVVPRADQARAAHHLHRQVLPARGDVVDLHEGSGGVAAPEHQQRRGRHLDRLALDPRVQRGAAPPGPGPGGSARRRSGSTVPGSCRRCAATSQSIGGRCSPAVVAGAGRVAG